MKFHQQKSICQLQFLWLFKFDTALALRKIGKQLLGIGTLLFLFYFKTHAQQKSANHHYPIRLLCGASIETLIEPSQTIFHASQKGFDAGIAIENKIIHSWSFCFLFLYHFRQTNNFKNEVDDPTYQLPVALNTSFTQQFIKTPVLVKYKFKYLHAGAGVSLSYLFASSVSQSILTNNFTDPKYQFSAMQGTAPFYKANISPILNVGCNFNKKIGIEYLIEYELLSNPRQFVCNKYNFLTSTLVLVYKL